MQTISSTIGWIKKNPQWANYLDKIINAFHFVGLLFSYAKSKEGQEKVALSLEAKKAPGGFEPPISCLLDRRFNQLSHGAR